MFFDCGWSAAAISAFLYVAESFEATCTETTSLAPPANALSYAAVKAAGGGAAVFGNGAPGAVSRFQN